MQKPIAISAPVPQGFIQRELRFEFAGAVVGKLKVTGLRALANVQAVSGRLGVSAQVRIWGLSLEEMNLYSSTLSAGVGVNEFTLVAEAGDLGGSMHKVIDGTIWRSYIDFGDAPESSFVVNMVDQVYKSAKMIQSNSWPGAQNAEDMIAAVCAAAGYTFINYGAHAVLRNMSTYGSAIDQIDDIARAAKFSLYLEGDKVWIWKQNTPIDAVIIETGPDAGMVGHPQYWEAGLIITMLYNPDVRVGRMLKVTSSIPKANGTWSIIQVNHDLGTMFHGAPWFTTAIVSKSISEVL
jgi:hypothetical protein